MRHTGGGAKWPMYDDKTLSSMEKCHPTQRKQIIDTHEPNAYCLMPSNQPQGMSLSSDFKELHLHRAQFIFKESKILTYESQPLSIWLN